MKSCIDLSWFLFQWGFSGWWGRLRSGLNFGFEENLPIPVLSTSFEIRAQMSQSVPKYSTSLLRSRAFFIKSIKFELFCNSVRLFLDPKGLPTEDCIKLPIPKELETAPGSQLSRETIDLAQMSIILAQIPAQTLLASSWSSQITSSRSVNSSKLTAFWRMGLQRAMSDSRVPHRTLESQYLDLGLCYSGVHLK